MHGSMRARGCDSPGLLDPDALFPVWRYHPFFTNTAAPVEQADITHRRHAIIETVFADLIDGPLAHIPSGRFGANSAWILCAAIAHNLLRAAGMLAGDQHTRARGSTLRRRIVNVPARLALVEGLACAVAQHHRIQPTNTRNSLTTRRKARPEQTGKAGQTSRCYAPLNDNQDHKKSVRPNHGPSVDRGLDRVRKMASGLTGSELAPACCMAGVIKIITGRRADGRRDLHEGHCLARGDHPVTYAVAVAWKTDLVVLGFEPADEALV